MKPTARSSTADEVRDSPWRRTAPRRFPAMLTPWRPSSPGHFWSWTAAGSVASDRSTTGSSSDLVRWREVAGFTALAYVIAWTVWAPLWPAALQSVVVGRTPSAYGGGSSAPVGMFAPALAALLMRLLFREGLGGVNGLCGPQPVIGAIRRRWMSVTTTSGRCRRTWSSRVVASPAAPTTSMSASASTCTMPSRRGSSLTDHHAKPGLLGHRRRLRPGRAATASARGDAGAVVTLPRVLVVDDDPGFRAVLRELLQARGYRVVGDAGDGDAAVAAAAALRPSAAVVDIHLPGPDGLAVAPPQSLPPTRRAGLRGGARATRSPRT